MRRLIDKFESKVLKTDSCWEWQASKFPKGYGQLKATINGKNEQYAHRISLYLYKNFDLTSDKLVCHKCDNPSCVNPDHLFVGTQTDNLKDMMDKGRHICWNRRLSNLDYELITFMRDLGVKPNDIGKEFGISGNYVCEITRKYKCQCL